jgi:hypothetical protein
MIDRSEIHASNETDLIRLFIDDIKQLQAVTTYRQEIWLGAQIRAAQILQNRQSKFLATERRVPSPEATLTWVYENLRGAWNILNKQAKKNKVPLPTMESIINESLVARHDLYSIKRSQVQRMLRRIEHADAQKLLDAAYSILEFVLMLPNSALEQIFKEITQNERLPSSSDFIRWVNCQDYTSHQVEAVLSNGERAKKNLLLGFFGIQLRLLAIMSVWV